jgi:hypothetical protein
MDNYQILLGAAGLTTIGINVVEYYSTKYCLDKYARSLTPTQALHKDLERADYVDRFMWPINSLWMPGRIIGRRQFKKEHGIQ